MVCSVSGAWCVQYQFSAWCVQYQCMVSVFSISAWCVQYQCMVCSVSVHGVFSISAWCVQYQCMVCSVSVHGVLGSKPTPGGMCGVGFHSDIIVREGRLGLVVIMKLL